MRVSLVKPSNTQLDHFLISGKNLSPSYSGKFDTRVDFSTKRKEAFNQKYDYDETSFFLGEGQAVFDTARQLVREWKMFPEQWTKIHPQAAPIKTGQRVAVLFNLLGIWWWNSNVIQYTIDEANRFGFAYGTLPGHVESGEELFLIEMDHHGKVWYKIKAFSRPASWVVRLVYPFARSQQRRFVRGSGAQIKKLVKILCQHA